MAHFSDRFFSANKLIIAAAVAYAGAVGYAHAEYVDTHANVVTECPMSDLGKQRLTDALTEARYNFSSHAFLGFRGLGFSDAEWARSSDDQMGDVMVRTARALSQVNDGALIPIADARGLRSFFYDDTLICLKNAYHETDAERSHRLAAEFAAADAAKERAAAAAAAQQKELALEAQQRATLESFTANPSALPGFLAKFNIGNGKLPVTAPQVAAPKPMTGDEIDRRIATAEAAHSYAEPPAGFCANLPKMLPLLGRDEAKMSKMVCHLPWRD